jgi:hypothetical protein
MSSVKRHVQFSSHCYQHNLYYGKRYFVSRDFHKLFSQIINSAQPILYYIQPWLYIMIVLCTTKDRFWSRMTQIRIDPQSVHWRDVIILCRILCIKLILLYIHI